MRMFSFKGQIKMFTFPFLSYFVYFLHLNILSENFDTSNNDTLKKPMKQPASQSLAQLNNQKWQISPLAAADKQAST